MLLASCHALHMPSSNPPSSLVGQSLLVAPPTRLPTFIAYVQAQQMISGRWGLVRRFPVTVAKRGADMAPDRDGLPDTAAGRLS